MSSPTARSRKLELVFFMMKPKKDFFSGVEAGPDRLRGVGELIARGFGSPAPESRRGEATEVATVSDEE
jgi:hypothetical protein